MMNLNIAKKTLGAITIGAALALATAAAAPAFAQDQGQNPGISVNGVKPGSRADVEASIRAKDWVSAERKIKMATAQHPNSAQAWYWQAQIEERLSNKAEAVSALQRAMQLDASLNFASPDAVNQMMKRLGMSGSQASQAPAARLSAPVPQPSGSAGGRATTGQNPFSTGSTEEAAAAKPAHHGGGWGTAIVILLLAGVVIGAIVFFMRRKSNAANETQRQSQRTALTSRALELKNRSERVAKDVKYEGQEGSKLGLAASDIDASASAMLQRAKSLPDNFDVSQESSRLDILEQHIESAEKLFRSKSWDTAPSAPGVPTPAAWSGASAQAPSQGYPQQAPQGYTDGYSGGYNNGPVYTPAPVIINQGPGLFETMMTASLINSMTGGGENRRLERELDDERYENQRLRDQQSSSNQGGYDNSYSAPAPAPAPIFDLGQSSNNGSDFDDDSRRRGSRGGDSGGVFDTGNNKDSDFSDGNSNDSGGGDSPSDSGSDSGSDSSWN
jgi:tetratricopeptide (TPR) repeat protein